MKKKKRIVYPIIKHGWMDKQIFKCFSQFNSRKGNKCFQGNKSCKTSSKKPTTTTTSLPVPPQQPTNSFALILLRMAATGNTSKHMWTLRHARKGCMHKRTITWKAAAATSSELLVVVKHMCFPSSLSNATFAIWISEYESLGKPEMHILELHSHLIKYAERKDGHGHTNP